MGRILEICCTSFESARNADQSGADRLELCDNIFEGGTTPSLGLIKKVKKQLKIKLYALIRPRGGDFCYSADEFEIIKYDIDSCRQEGVDGIVSGVLNIDGTIDVVRTKELVIRSQDMDFTFHRAFDLVKDYRKGLEDVIATGASRILTSGLKENVVDGAATLKDLLERSNGRIIVMAGGGLNSKNIQKIIDETGCNEFHTTAKKWINSSSQVKPNINLNASKDIPETMKMVASTDEIDKLKIFINANQ